MKFEEALIELKEGYKLQRAGWNGKGLFVWVSNNTQFLSIDRPVQPNFFIEDSNGKLNTWVPSVSDLFAEDWQLA